MEHRHLVLIQRCLTSVALLTGFSLGGALGAADQPPSVPMMDAFTALTRLDFLGRNIKQKFDNEPKLVSISDQLSSDATFLRERWRVLDIGTSAGREYQWSLTYLVASADGITDLDADKVAELARDIADDLHIKVEQCREVERLTMKLDLAPAVEVTVNTQKNGAKTSGYLIRCNPRRWAKVAPPIYVFTNPSTPTIRGLPPGNYVMWSERNGQKGRPTDISIGGDGKLKQTVAFEVE